MKLLFTSTLAITLLLLVFSCEKKTPTPPLGSGDPSFSCKIDGQNFDAHPLLIVGSLSSPSGIYTLSIAGLTVTSTDSTVVLVSCLGQDFSELTDGTVFSGTGSVFDKLGFGNYFKGFSTIDDIEGSSTETLDATITITAIDKDEKLVSGTFNFVVEDPDTDILYAFTSGVFNNVEYH